MLPKRRYATLLAAVAVTVAGFFGPGMAMARAESGLLVASDPYEHQELTDPPSGVVLAFSRAVDAAAARIVVTDAAGANVNINSLDVEGTNVTVQVRPDLPKGTYTVHYQVNRSSGGIEGGAFQFSYGPGAWTDLPDREWSGESAQPSVIASPPEQASADPTTATSDPVPAESVTPQASPSATAPATPVDGGAGVGWLAAGAVLLVAVLAAGGLLVWRRRGRGSRAA